MDIKESIAFAFKLLQFPEIGILLNAKTDGVDPKANKYEGFSFQSYEADENGKHYPVYHKDAGGIPESKLEAFYNQLYIVTEKENPNLKLSSFYKLELKYIEGLSTATKEEYYGVIDCITDYLKAKIKSMATIVTYPHQLEYADISAQMAKERFKQWVASTPSATIYKMLSVLPDELKDMLAKAKAENPETAKRILVEARLIAFRWYYLDHIEDSPCNMLLYKLKNEIRWYIQEIKVIYESLNTFKSFDDLYDSALYYGTVDNVSNDVVSSNQKHYHQFCFNVWLHENKNWKLDDETHYQKLLTKDNWLAYLAYEKQEAEKLKAAYEADKATWQPQSLKQALSGNITVEQIKEANNKHHTELLNWLSIVGEFEEPNCKVQLFGKGNEHFKEQGKLDYKEIEEARKTNNKEVFPYPSRSLIHSDSIHEADASELEALFQEKFKAAIERKQYKTEARFAKYEVGQIITRFGKFREGFPILNQWIEFLEAKALQVNPVVFEQLKTKTDQLKIELSKHGFYSLPMVKSLSKHNQEKLIELIGTNDLPYQIAMFHFLDYLKYLQANHFSTKAKLNAQISAWLNSDKEGRTVKGNISTLSPKTNENKTKYTAHLHKETVKKDYQKLK